MRRRETQSVPLTDEEGVKRHSRIFMVKMEMRTSTEIEGTYTHIFA